MKVTSNPISEKQTSLERQLRSKEILASTRPTLQSPKLDEKITEKGAALNETSQYLKVLSRVENLLIQNKLPDAAIEGFAGAVKKQIDAMTDVDKQMLMKLPELKILELDELSDIPEMIKSDIRNEEKNTALLKFLRIPEFAELMRTDNKTESKTYTANSTLQPLITKPEDKIFSESPQNYEKKVQTSSAQMTPNINQKANAYVTNRSV